MKRIIRYLRLPGKALSAIVRCGFPVAAGLVARELFPCTGRARYERAVRRFLLRRFCDVTNRYENRVCPAGHLPAGSPVWVFLPGRNPEGDARLLQTVRREASSRPVCPIGRLNYRGYVRVSDTLAARLSRMPDEVLSGFLLHALLSQRDGTYADARSWQSGRLGDPVHGFVSDLLAACHTARLPIADEYLPGILTRLAADCIPDVRRRRRRLDALIRYACALPTVGIGQE